MVAVAALTSGKPLPSVKAGFMVDDTTAEIVLDPALTARQAVGAINVIGELLYVAGGHNMRIRLKD
jgi:hypothetical protein